MTEEQFEDDFLFDDGEDGGSSENTPDGPADSVQQDPVEDALAGPPDDDDSVPFGVPPSAEASFPEDVHGSGDPFGDFDEAADEPAVDDADDDLDEIFLLEGLESASLDSMFEAPSTDAVIGDEIETEEDMLFGEVPPAAGSAFDGASPKGRFHERAADAWAGDDMDLDELVGASAEESAAQLSPKQPEPVIEDEAYAEDADDLFMMEDVEVELVDGPQPQPAETEFAEPQLSEPLLSEPVAAERKIADWDEIRPLSHEGDDSWVDMPLAESTSEEAEPVAASGAMEAASGFGGGRNDEFFAAEEQAIDPSELEVSEDQPEGLEPLAENWDDDAEQEPLDPDHEEYDPIYGAEASQDGDEEEYWEEEPDWRTYEDEYVDETEQAPGLRVVGPGEGRRSRLPKFAAAAAVLLVTFAGGVAMLRPEWVWPGEGPALVARVPISKPVLKPALPEPTAPALVATTPEVVPETTPEIDPVAVVTPETPETPVVIDPVTPETPETPPVAVAPEIDPQGGEDDKQQPVGPLLIGDEFEIVDDALLADAEAPFPDLEVGSKAFAQLHNEAFFIGVVKKRDATHVTLRMTTGEVSLAYASLQTLAPIGDADTGEVTEAADGFVRLSNDQRIYGTLIRSKNADGVILRTEDSRIQVPYADVADFGVAKKGGAEPVFDDDDAWLDEQVRRRMNRTARPTTPPRPGGR